MFVASPIAALPPMIDQYLEWWIGGFIIVFGLFIYGLRDLLIFSPSRVWAISSVCFAESIRKRVLWITPLAILGVILISQFQRPIDEADAVRQMLKVCLFASGVVVTITAVILACTNLPKEIENRVIFTIVTKPITRLEIVFGKVLGFARVSAAILLIMGLFTFGYMYFNSFSLQRGIGQRLETIEAGAAVRPTLEYYRDNGLLTARGLASAQSMRILAREPDSKPGDNFQEAWILGTEGDVLVAFDLPPELLIPPGDATNTPLSAGLVVQVKVGFDARLAPKPVAAPSVLPPAHSTRRRDQHAAVGRACGSGEGGLRRAACPQAGGRPERAPAYHRRARITAHRRRGRYAHRRVNSRSGARDAGARQRDGARPGHSTDRPRRQSADSIVCRSEVGAQH